jgi:hypothetical protein
MLLDNANAITSVLMRPEIQLVQLMQLPLRKDWRITISMLERMSFYIHMGQVSVFLSPTLLFLKG